MSLTSLYQGCPQFLEHLTYSMNGGHPTVQYFQLSLNTPFAKKKEDATLLFIIYSEDKKMKIKIYLGQKASKIGQFSRSFFDF